MGRENVTLDTMQIIIRIVTFSVTTGIQINRLAAVINSMSYACKHIQHHRKTIIIIIERNQFILVDRIQINGVYLKKTLTRVNNNGIFK